MACKRCGKCCKNGDFWWDSEHPLMQSLHKALYDRDVKQNEDGECLFLADINGVATCLIEKYLGTEAKPQVCKDYPCKGAKCFNDRA
jgi:hypothetical protein